MPETHCCSYLSNLLLCGIPQVHAETGCNSGTNSSVPTGVQFSTGCQRRPVASVSLLRPTHRAFGFCLVLSLASIGPALSSQKNSCAGLRVLIPSSWSAAPPVLPETGRGSMEAVCFLADAPPAPSVCGYWCGAGSCGAIAGTRVHLDRSSVGF